MTASAQATQELAQVTSSLESQLSSLQDQLDRLKLCKAVLVHQHNKQFQDRSTQADVGPQINPLRHVKRLNHSAPFCFTTPRGKVNWKRLRQLDVAALAASGDAASAMQLFEDVAHGDFEQGSIYELSEANLTKLLKLAQLQLQYMQYKLEEKVGAEQALEDDSLAIAAGLSSLAAPSLGDIHQGLGALQADLNQLGSSRVNGLIQQVRQEERSAAKSALMQAIAKSKQQVDAKYGKQLQQTSSQPSRYPDKVTLVQHLMQTFGETAAAKVTGVDWDVDYSTHLQQRYKRRLWHWMP